jgi:VanZ family protein
VDWAPGQAGASNERTGRKRQGSRLVALWLPVIVYMVAIFVSSSISSPPSPPGPMTDKQVHVLMYAGLSALIVRALSGGWFVPPTPLTLFLAVAISTLYGISDEIHQYFVPPRTMDAADVQADIVGATLAALTLAAAAALRSPRV